MVIKDKKGWTTVVEVFVSILLLAALVTVILNSGVVQEKTKSQEIYKEQALVLKIIQLDDGLRAEVLDENEGVIQNAADNTIPDYLECRAKICDLNEICNLDSPPEKKEIYVKSVLITATNTEYNPKELKLFCWEE